MAPATATGTRRNILATAAHSGEADARRKLFDLVTKLAASDDEPPKTDAKALRLLLAETGNTSADVDGWVAALARRAELQTLAGSVGEAVERRRAGRAELKAARQKLADLRETVEQLERGLGRLGAGVRDSLRAEEQLAELEYEHGELFGVARPDDLDTVTLLSGGEVIGVADESAPELHVPGEVLREQTQRRSRILRAARAEAQSANSEAFDSWRAQGFRDANGRWQPPRDIPAPEKVEPTWASIATLTRAERDRLAIAGAKL
jgi:chromosome segregation ATPase